MYVVAMLDPFVMGAVVVLALEEGVLYCCTNRRARTNFLEDEDDLCSPFLDVVTLTRPILQLAKGVPKFLPAEADTFTWRF